MPKKGERMSDEQKHIRSEAAKRQHAEGRGNPAGILSPAARAKSRQTSMGHKRSPTGEKHPHWKGEDAGYVSKHMWLSLHHPKTGICEHCSKECGTAKPTGTEWCNISGEYRRDRSDYLELCRSCHRKHDYAVRPYRIRNGTSKVNDGDVRAIRALGLNRDEIMQQYGLSRRAAQDIITGRTWGGVV